jgi:signal transduction histidine kinase
MPKLESAIDAMVMKSDEQGVVEQSRAQNERPDFAAKPAGTGVGLTIARLIVDAHGGRLWHSANLPHGAIFQFTLPATLDSRPRVDERDA